VALLPRLVALQRVLWRCCHVSWHYREFCGAAAMSLGITESSVALLPCLVALQRVLWRGCHVSWHYREFCGVAAMSRGITESSVALLPRLVALQSSVALLPRLVALQRVLWRCCHVSWHYREFCGAAAMSRGITESSVALLPRLVALHALFLSITQSTGCRFKLFFLHPAPVHITQPLCQTNRSVTKPNALITHFLSPPSKLRDLEGKR